MVALIHKSVVCITVHVPIIERKLAALSFEQHGVAGMDAITHGVSPRLKFLNQHGEPWKVM